MSATLDREILVPLLAAASRDTAGRGGDPRRLSDLFGLSIQHAVRYTNTVAGRVLDQ